MLGVLFVAMLLPSLQGKPPDRVEYIYRERESPKKKKKLSYLNPLLQIC